jgi:hypothetical protein
LNTPTTFSRRRPDVLAEELVVVLRRKTGLEFKALFEILHENLRARDAAKQGEEMLRLRAYEALQRMVYSGSVKKVEKKYRGIASALTALSVQLQLHRASCAHDRPPKLSDSQGAK